MKKRIFLSAVRSLCVAAALAVLPSCEKKAPEPDLSDYGTMNITSEPSGAEVSILGKVIGVTPRITNPVPAAMYIVKFTKEGYEPAWLPVNVTSGRQVEAHAVLVPESATVVIDSDPRGAHVRMNGRDYGDTPVLLSDLPIGSYSASVQLEGYTNRDISWKVQNARPILIPVPMMNNIGELKVSSTPAGADVEIDGKVYGSTPFQDSLKQGEYKVRLTKPGYKTIEKNVIVKIDETTNVNIDMEMLPGSLFVDSDPTGAKILINDVDYGETPCQRDSIDAGDYVVTLIKDGFDTLNETVTVRPGDVSKHTLILKPNTGTIVLSVNPPGVNIYLDKKFICRTEADTSRTKSRDISKRISLKNLAAGAHTVTVTNRYATPSAKELTVFVGAGETVQVPEITLWLPDTTIVLKNGSKYTGRLADKYSDSPDADKVSFRHSAGITSEYKKSEIQEIIPLNIMDGD